VLIGLPRAGIWREVLNSDALEFGGSGRGNLGAVTARATPAYGQPASARVFLPPLCTIYLAPEAWAVQKPAEAETINITTLGTKHA
jgi:1,4-alpha-glucan branching enzyme